eukprot:scaffold322560_cov31-Tisochrysis_lutea.AAC.3
MQVPLLTAQIGMDGPVTRANSTEHLRFGKGRTPRPVLKISHLIIEIITMRVNTLVGQVPVCVRFRSLE